VPQTENYSKGVYKVRTVLELHGLDCAGCAAKIEAGAAGIKHVNNASLNFVNKTLALDINHPDHAGDVISNVRKIVNDIEPGVRVIPVDKAVGPAGRHTLKEGLGRHNRLARILIGATALIAALAFQLVRPLELALYATSYALVGGEVVLTALRNISKGRIFDENLLMGIATIGAFAIGEYPEGVAVMLFYQVGEYFQDMAVNRSRRSIASLMDIRPDYANVMYDGREHKMAPEQVAVGDIIIIRPGERVPLDGRVIDGSSMLDTSALTGESVPAEVSAGSEVLGGFINKNGVITVEVLKPFGESAVARILDLVENAGSKKARIESFITRFAGYYTPAVVFTALGLAVIPPLVMEGANPSDWFYRALVFLVVSCPCALVVSIPLGFFGGIGGASKNGILVKGGNYLEALSNVETVVFDKTGTLTKGVFSVTRIIPADGVTEQQLMEYAATAESFSNHPVAVSILEAYQGNIDRDSINSYREIPGRGIEAVIAGRKILAGNAGFMAEHQIEFACEETAGTVIYIAVEGEYKGRVLISDQLKEDAAEAVHGLKALGVKKTVMLTGDNRSIAMAVASTLGIDEVHAELLPDRKVEMVEALQNQRSTNGRLVFVGDGINDAPVLARADIGIAMGGLGSDAAIEAADVVLMTDEPSKLISAIGIARRTKAIVWQNIALSLAVKGMVLGLGAAGMASMWQAVFADVGVALLAVINSIRAIHVKL
jgi:Cd2+/Zn2+-exporting ATPase